jgi:hypothetical protein
MSTANAHLQPNSICQKCLLAHLILGERIPAFTEA